ncbi:MAG: GAF domain-containing protein [Anaerolineae bacterium]|jgi:GAF domain-containing protein
MLTRIRQLLATPVFEDDEDKTRVGSLLNIILLTLLAAAAVIPPTLVLIEPTGAMATLLLGIVMAVLLLGLLFLIRLGFVQMSSVLLLCALLAGLVFNTYSFGVIHGYGVTTFFVVIVMAGLLLGERAAIIFGLLSILVAVGAFYAEASGVLVPIETKVEVTDLIILITTFGLTSLLLRFAVRSIDEGFDRARRNAQALAETNRELQNSRDTLQTQTDDLARRARYLEATAEVARDVAAVLDLQDLLTRVVTLVSERFGFYHTGIFLLDPAGEWAVLQSASSEGGQRMLARGHRLRVGEEGIVGYVTGRGEPRIALDVGADAVFFDNPDLPDTRSEMALPLRAGGEIIGALDVQSKEPQAFSDEDVAVLQTLADQVAMAISNARLFQRAQESLEAERRAYGEISRQAWEQVLRARPTLGYLCDTQGNVKPATSRWRSEMVQAAQEGRILQEGGNAVAIPVKIRDHTLGVVRLRKPDGGSEWTAEEIALMGTLTEQLGVALESARLYQDTQRRAERERMTGEVMARMRETLDVETVLKTAVNEMYQALGLDEIVIRLITEEDGQLEPN